MLRVWSLEAVDWNDQTIETIETIESDQVATAINYLRATFEQAELHVILEGEPLQFLPGRTLCKWGVECAAGNEKEKRQDAGLVSLSVRASLGIAPPARRWRRRTLLSPTRRLLARWSAPIDAADDATGVVCACFLFCADADADAGARYRSFGERYSLDTLWLFKDFSNVPPAFWNSCSTENCAFSLLIVSYVKLILWNFRND